MTEDTKPTAVLPLMIADIYELAGRFRESGEAIARTVGQTQARWQVLSAASGAPRTVPQIARRLGVSRQNVQRIADLLVSEHCAAFEPNPDHRRSPYVVLSKRGRDALNQLTARADVYHERLARNLTGHDVSTIHRGLRLLVDATEDHATPNPKRKDR